MFPNVTDIFPVEPSAGEYRVRTHARTSHSTPGLLHLTFRGSLLQGFSEFNDLPNEMRVIQLVCLCYVETMLREDVTDPRQGL